jgi:hypothetical protein
MRAVIISLIAVAGLTAPVQAAPAVPHDIGVAAPAIIMVRQRCGEGMKRDRAWQDKNGAWHGRCVPKH